jgi:ribosomal protein S2
MNQIRLLKLLDGIFRMEELKKILRVIKLDQDFSTLLELSQQVMVPIRVSEVL